MASGTLVAESLRVGTTLHPPSMVVRSISRADCGDEASGQPRTWTFVEFELPDEHAAAWAQDLTQVLQSEHGWYCDFRTGDETFVVFAGTLFRYPRGNREGRARAANHARSVGVPEHQLDWPE